MRLDPDSSHQLILLVIFVLLAGLFETWSIALEALIKMHIRQLSVERHEQAVLLNKFLDKPTVVFNTLLFGNTVSSLAVAILGTMIAVNHGYEGWSLVGSLTGLILIFMIVGRVVPSVLGKRYANEISSFFIRIIIFFKYLFYPFIKFFEFIEYLFTRNIGMEEPEVMENGFIEEEIFNMVASGQDTGSINQVEKNMIHGVFEFTDMVVKEVMTPRPDITAVEKNTSYEELIRIIKEEQFSRIPVYDNSIDNILGVVHIKDLIFLQEKERTLFSSGKYVRQTFFVPETKKISELFVAMKKEKIHMAIVLDEYGSTAGLVTMEDLIEEIMGDIQDEHDKEEPLLQHIDDNIVEVNASMRIEEFNEMLAVNLQCEEADTVGGLVFTVLDRVPVEGDKVKMEELEMTVWEMEGHRIEKLRINRSLQTVEEEV